MSQSVFGAAAVVTMLNRAFTNSSPAAAVFGNQVQNAGTTADSQFAFARQFGASFDGLDNAALTNLVLGNMGMLPDSTGLVDFVTNYLDGVAKVDRGVVVLQLGMILAGLENATGDLAVYAPKAVAWNKEVEQSFVYSSNSANTSPYIGDFAPTPVDQGQTFTLTQGVDVFNLGNGKATNGNDTYVAADHNRTNGSNQSIFGLGDDIDGGAGTNKLVVLGDVSLGSIQVAKFANMQNAELTSDSVGNQATDLSSLVAGGLQKVTVVEGGGVTVDNINKSINAGVKGAALAGDAGVVFNYTDATTMADAAALTLTGATGNLPTVARNVTTTGIESLTVAASGVSNVNLVDGFLRSLTLNATGETVLNLASSNVSKIDASASTADTMINAVPRAGVLDYKGGAGDDRIDVSGGAFTNVNSKFAGGEGADNLALNGVNFDTATAAHLAAVNKLDGFEQFTVVGAGNTATINAGNVTSVKKFGFENTGAIDLTNVSNDHSFVVNGVLNNAGTQVQMKTGQTVLNLDIDSAAGGAGLQNVMLNDVQTLNLESNKAGANHAANQFVDVLNFATTNFTVKVTGDQDLVLGQQAKQAVGVSTPGFTSKVNIDASAFTGKLVAHGSVDADVIKGGAGNDVIRGGAGADVLTGNGGNDTFVFAFGNTTAGAVPAVAEVVDVTGLTAVTNSTAPVSFSITHDALKDGNPVTYTITDATGAFQIANDIADYAAAIQTYLQAQIGANITVTATDADTLRFTDANGGDLTGATFMAPSTPATIYLNVVDATDVSSISLTLNGTLVSVNGLTGTDTEAGLAAALQTAVRAAHPSFADFTVVAGVVANQLVLADPAGSNLSIPAFQVRDDITVPAQPAVASSTDIAFADLANFANTKEITINGTPVDVSAVAGNGVGVAAAVQAGLVGSTVTWNQSTLTLNVQYANGTAINEAGIVADNTFGPGGAASVIIVTEKAAGLAAVAQVGGVVVGGASAVDNNDGVPSAAYGTVTTTEFQDGALAVPGVGPTSEANITALDTITDFVKGADKIDLVAFDNTDVGVPSKAWFAGDVTATAGANNLAGALALAVTDVNGSSQTGSVALGANEAVFFMYGGNTYALINDGDAGYSATNDVLIKFTGSLDLAEGALSVPTFFA